MVFKSGQTLTVKGIPNGNASSRFSVNIGYSQQDIALHVNPRFDSNTVVCNTCQNGVWGPEVIGKGFPFKQGVEFTVTEIKNVHFRSGQTLTVKAVPEADADRISVNIGYSQQDIALHVNPRFDTNTVVCNACHRGVWGQEVYGNGFPFEHGVEFTITVTFLPDEFLVALPDDSFIYFPNRLGATEYPYFFSKGGLRIESFEII
ncbi:beta-galactoside-binding lectin-like [Neosynchiropus ocellatus]